METHDLKPDLLLEKLLHESRVQVKSNKERIRQIDKELIEIKAIKQEYDKSIKNIQEFERLSTLYDPNLEKFISKVPL